MYIILKVKVHPSRANKELAVCHSYIWDSISYLLSKNSRSDCCAIFKLLAYYFRMILFNPFLCPVDIPAFSVFTDESLFVEAFVEHVRPVEDLPFRFRRDAFVYVFPVFYEGLRVLYFREYGISPGIITLRVPHALYFAEDVLYVMVPVRPVA